MRNRLLCRLFGATLTVALAACGADSDSGGGDCESALVVGDLVITEIYVDAPSEDAGNEWWEIYNATSETLNLRGLSLVSSRDDLDGPKTHTMSEIVIAPGQYLTVGGVLEEFKAEYIDYGYGGDLGQLRNTNGRLALACGDTIIDEITYEDSDSGVSTQLSGAIAPDHIANDDPANFCTESPNEFFTDQFGTPQSANDSCGPVNQNECMDNGTLRAVVKAVEGDVTISEFMPNPSAVGDGEGEWIELRINAAIDLNGLQLGSAGTDTCTGEVRDTIVASECLTAGPGDFFVLANNTDIGTNGNVEADYELGFSLTNSNNAIFIGVDGSPIDTVGYSSVGDGEATQIDDLGTACDAVMPYGVGGTGDLGTPGAANPTCMADLRTLECVVASDMCLDGGTPRPLVPPTMGNLTISEWMANPATPGGDANREWLELTATGAFDLNGLEIDLTEAGGPSFTLASPNCLSIAADGFFVIAETADTDLNRGVTIVDYEQSNLAFTNDGSTTPRTLSISFGGTLFDTQTYTLNTPSGEAYQIDDNGVQCLADTVNDGYGPDENFGTPGEANSPDCTALP